jgi:hypothetical protein
MCRREGDIFLMGVNENVFVVPKNGWNFGSKERFGKVFVLLH